jgi:hypothetical protein
MNFMIAFLVVCIALGLWGPKKVRWLPWLIPIGAVLLVAFFLLSNLNRI